MAFGWAITSTGAHADSRIAPAMKLIPDAELVAICSRDQARADAFAQKHGARAAYHSLEALLKDPQVDGVFIASPNSLHAEQTIQAAQAGKHILTEKPMSTSVADAVAMAQACRRHGVKLGVAYHLRHHPAHIESRRLIAEGVLGQISLAHGMWASGVRGITTSPATDPAWRKEPKLVGDAGSLMATGVHALDLLHFLLGQEVVEVAAISNGQNRGQPLETLLTASLRFARGTIGTIWCGRPVPDRRNDFVIYGSYGRVSSVDTLWGDQQGSLEVVSQTVNLAKEYPTDRLASFVGEIRGFQQAVQEDVEPAATGLDGIGIVQATSAIIESAKTGRTIKIEPVPV